MIERTQAYRTADGQTHPDLESAQRHEIAALLCKERPNRQHNEAMNIAEDIVANAEAFLDILTTRATSKPRARKINGGTKKRVPKATPVIREDPTE